MSLHRACCCGEPPPPLPDIIVIEFDSWDPWSPGGDVVFIIPSGSGPWSTPGFFNGVPYYFERVGSTNQWRYDAGDDCWGVRIGDVDYMGLVMLLDRISAGQWRLRVILGNYPEEGEHLVVFDGEVEDSDFPLNPLEFVNQFDAEDEPGGTATAEAFDGDLPAEERRPDKLLISLVDVVPAACFQSNDLVNIWVGVDDETSPQSVDIEIPWDNSIQRYERVLMTEANGGTEPNILPTDYPLYTYSRFYEDCTNKAFRTHMLTVIVEPLGCDLWLVHVWGQVTGSNSWIYMAAIRAHPYPRITVEAANLITSSGPQELPYATSQVPSGTRDVSHSGGYAVITPIWEDE
jgi:hypothetical protein